MNLWCMNERKTEKEAKEAKEEKKHTEKKTAKIETSLFASAICVNDAEHFDLLFILLCCVVLRYAVCVCFSFLISCAHFAVHFTHTDSIWDAIACNNSSADLLQSLTMIQTAASFVRLLIA